MNSVQELAAKHNTTCIEMAMAFELRERANNIDAAMAHALSHAQGDRAEALRHLPIPRCVHIQPNAQPWRMNYCLPCGVLMCDACAKLHFAVFECLKENHANRTKTESHPA